MKKDEVFRLLGFSWDRSGIPPDENPRSAERALFHYNKLMPQFVFDASALEGNPFTYPEVKTLMDGVTVGGRRVSDAQQVLGIASAARDLFTMLRTATFNFDKATSDRLHALVAHQAALEWGHFRGEGREVIHTPNVGLGAAGYHEPPPTIRGAENLKSLFQDGLQALSKDIHDPRERGMAYFLFATLHQFYFDANKRTARFMMNGLLMQNGLEAISIPATQAQAFNEKMVGFFTEKDSTEMMFFLVACQTQNCR